jgi:hypothetical protein
MHFLLILWWRRLRRDHTWLAAMAPPLDIILEVTQPQRVAVLCLIVLINMAFSAIFLGTDASVADRTAAVGLLSAVRVVAVTQLLVLACQAP